jgi:uncharacterized protein YyaL (SSP411 family)
MHRPIVLSDEALPSRAGVAAYSLQRLGFLLGEERYLHAAEKTLQNAWQSMQQFPHGHVSLLTALEEYVRHPEIIVIRGRASDIEIWRDATAKLYAPRRLVFAIDKDCAKLPGALAGRVAHEGRTVAYRCVGSHCSLPLESLDALAEAISESVPAATESDSAPLVAT